MKKQILACALVLMSITSHNALAQLPPTFVDTFKLLGSKIPSNVNYDVVRNGCTQSYDWLRTSCVSLPVVANNPAFQQIVKDNFAAISSIVGILGAFGAYWLAQTARQWNIRRKDNNFRDAYRQMKPEERTALLLTTLTQLPELLKAIPNGIEFAAQMMYRGVPLSLKVPGYSQNAFDITITGDTHIPIRLNIENHLGREQGEYHFTSPYRQSAINTNIGSLRKLLSKNNAHVIGRMANVLANLPARNYTMNKDGSLTILEANRNVQSLLESDAVASAIRELEKQPYSNTEDVSAACKRLTVDVESIPYMTLQLESKGFADVVELKLIDNVSGNVHSFIIEDAPVIPSQQQVAGDRTRQVADAHSTLRLESGLDRLKRGWAGGRVSSGSTDNKFLRYLQPDGLIHKIYDSVVKNPTLQTAYVIEPEPNIWQISAEATRLHDERPICSSSVLPGATCASSSNAQHMQPLPDLMNNNRLYDGDDEIDIMSLHDKKPFYYATLRGIQYKQ